jgi:AAA15 family ATPase/GTPase
MTLFVDELDSSLHPLIVREIVKLFNSLNNKSSQLVFTSHDISLLDDDILTKEQIWFTDKNKYGNSFLYSLADYT